MSENADIRQMIRDLAVKRDSIDRRQLYFALIEAEVWVPVRLESPMGHVTPSDLHPLDREALGGRAAFAFFTHLAAAEAWQTEEGVGEALRVEQMPFVQLLPLLLDAGAGSAFINPVAKFAGEFYRHELETMLDGAKRLAAGERRASVVASKAAAQEESKRAWWRRLMGH